MSTPRVEVDVTRQIPDDARGTIRLAFAEEGLDVPIESRSAFKAAPFDLGLVVSFVLGATVGGLIYDAEKETIRRGLAATRRVMVERRTNARVLVERGDEITEYLMPGSGPEGDAAIAALEADYESLTRRGGARVWMPGEGWIPERELIDRMENRTLSPEAQAIQDQQWVEFWEERGRENAARLEALRRASGEPGGDGS